MTQGSWISLVILAHCVWVNSIFELSRFFYVILYALVFRNLRFLYYIIINKVDTIKFEKLINSVRFCGSIFLWIGNCIGEYSVLDKIEDVFGNNNCRFS